MEGKRNEDHQRWVEVLRPYWGPDPRRSVGQLVVTSVLFFGCWALAYRALEVGWWLTLILAVPTAGLLMRMFLVQHDIGHGSYFRSRRVAEIVGFLLGVVTLTPYGYWRRTHAHHHAHSGDLDFRGLGDLDTLTVREFEALPWLGRLRYRLYRHPLVMFGLGPLWVFALKHRYPWDIPRDWERAWRSVRLTNLVILAVLAVLLLTLGPKAVLLVHGPVLVLSGAAGVWLFYVQHQFEDTYWHEHREWDFFDAGLHGSSHLVLPRPLQWLTANIGLHHIHHMSARIPNYKLQEVLDAHPELDRVTKITLWDGLKTLRLALWDETERRLVSFREARRLARARPAG